jgi:hypothetical protein
MATASRWLWRRAGHDSRWDGGATVCREVVYQGTEFSVRVSALARMRANFPAS